MRHRSRVLLLSLACSTALAAQAQNPSGSLGQAAGALPPAPQDAATGGSATSEPVTNIDAVQVTGSRIPRAQIEGPAPIMVVTAEQIQAAGLMSVPDVLRSLSQNNGYTQGQQNTTGAQSTPGAQSVSLRGLGPNHTLVLINGRRIADFPLPLNGRSNFTDIGNIPLGMIDRVEVLTGSASAVYGSDAMAGVINFILKDHADGTTLDYRFGGTSNGGGQSFNATLTTGFERGEFSGIFGVEVQDRKPLWGTDRDVQASTLNAPTARARLPRLIAQIYDWDDDVNIAPADDCQAMSRLNEGTTVLAEGWYGDPYCGSERAIAYRTITNERKGFNAYGSFKYRLNDSLTWFADVQLGRQDVRLLTGTGGNESVSDHMGWELWDPLSSDPRSAMFYNMGTGHYEVWSRQFSPEEVGGLRNRMNTTTQKTLGVTTGLEGYFGEGWGWEAAYNHSEYRADVDMPRIKAAAANNLFLGPLLGYDADGYPIYDPDPARIFTPLTPEEFAAIGAMSTFRPKAENDNFGFTVDNTSLFSMPAGDVGFAGALEYGRQSYAINPDPLALTEDAYTPPRYGDGEGSRSRWSAAGEVRVPLASTLDASLAGRYDRYSYGNKNPGKFTYSAGLEWRPLETLLVRGSYGTGFRAPDMHFLFAGNDYYRGTWTDYYVCRSENPGASHDGCWDWDYGDYDVRTFDVYSGNMDLDVETSKSFTAGVVWSPIDNFDLSLDYYQIRVMNQVQTQSRDQLLMDEANCRLGVTDDGATVDTSSPTCADAIARVIRDGDGVITSVHFGPINIASEETSGIDLSASYRLRTANAGDFRFTGNHTWVYRHRSQQYPGDPWENLLDVSEALAPRAKSNLGMSWDKGQWGGSLFGTYLGRVPNYAADEWGPSTWRFNAGARYDVNSHLRMSLSVNNLFDKMPPVDPTWAKYPYYDTAWFDSLGRTYYLQITAKFGGSAL